MANKEARKAGPDCKVVCSWCGVVSERGRTEDSCGMCPKCFARKWEEHTRPHIESGVPRWASER